MQNLSNFLGAAVTAGFTDREQGSFALPDTNDEEIFNQEQKQQLFREGIDLERIFHIRQIHGSKVVNVNKVVSSDAGRIPEADGVVTGLDDVVLTVRSADCIPIFLYDPARHCTGLIHAGWKSTQQNIAGEALKLMYQNFGTYPSDVRAVFGPSVRDCCYQVDQEFCEVFPEAMVPRNGNWFLNLQAVNLRQLTDFGVRQENIHDTQMCTCCNERFFSWRREGQSAGRHLSLLKLKNEGER